MKHLIPAALLLCGLPLAGAAQRPGGPPRLVLQALDSDGDGTLSETEIAAAPAVLIKLDRNGDGSLTPDELSPRPENAGATADELVQQLMAFDKNGDGVLTSDELPARLLNLFDRADSNKDGKLTPDELRAMARRQGMPSGGTEGIRRMSGMMKNDPLLFALDTNHDGVISPDEIAAAAKSLALLDVNHDGTISPDEMRPHQQTPEERTDHMLDEWDTNKDGRISKAEAPDRMQQSFESLDKNNDGFLDRAELLEYFKTIGSGQRGPGGPNGATHGTEGGQGKNTGATTTVPKEQKQ